MSCEHARMPTGATVIVEGMMTGCIFCEIADLRTRLAAAEVKLAVAEEALLAIINKPHGDYHDWQAIAHAARDRIRGEKKEPT